MELLPALARAEQAVEMLDGPAAFTDLFESLQDIARLNAVFGGGRVALVHVRRLLSRLPPARAITVVDVGTGAGDIPRALVRWARRAGRRIRVLALDRDFPTLRVARRFVAGYPEISLVQGDALALPLRPAGADIVISALTLHHLDGEAAVRYFTELDAGARAGFIVNDLERGRLAYSLVWLTTRILVRSRMTRHDGPVSVLRAYTAGEVRRLCEKAGLLDVRVIRHPALLRLCAVRVKT